MLRSPSHSCIWGGELSGSCYFEFLWELSVEVRPQQASVLACVILAGTRELVSPRSSKCELVVVLRHRVIRWDRSIVKILHSVEGGDVEQVCSNLETNLPCLRLLSLFLICVYIFLAYIAYLFICLIYFVLNCYIIRIVCSHLYSTKRVIVASQLLI